MGKRFYILVLLLTLAFKANCQSIFSTIYNMDNGLSNNRVNTITQDKNGFMWFGTDDGLCRFDGIKFKTYILSDYIDENASSYITHLFIDSQNMMWIGTNNGITIFDYTNNKFKAFKAFTRDSIKIATPVLEIAEDKDGNVWIGTFQNGLDKFDYETETFRNYKDNSTDNLLYHIHDITEFSPGNPLVASDNGVCYFTTDDMKIKRADDTSIKFRFSPE